MECQRFICYSQTRTTAKSYPGTRDGAERPCARFICRFRHHWGSRAQDGTAMDNGRIRRHCQTLILPRLKKIVDGEDPGGISEHCGWQGGGGFRYYRIAPSLLQEDKWGNWVIVRNTTLRCLRRRSASSKASLTHLVIPVLAAWPLHRTRFSSTSLRLILTMINYNSSMKKSDPNGDCWCFARLFEANLIGTPI